MGDLFSVRSAAESSEGSSTNPRHRGLTSVGRTVYHDDSQSLAEAPLDQTGKFLREFLEREISHVPITTFCYMVATPDICLFESRMGEVYGDRLSPKQRRQRLEAGKPGYIKGIEGLRSEGTDILRLVCDVLRPRGLEVLATIRMNDTHHMSLDPEDPACARFALENPQYVIRQPDGRTNETALDYSYEEVREHRLAIMREIVEDYDVNGLELNFNRWAKHFPRHEGREKAHIMTDFVRTIRELLDEAAPKKGREHLTLGAHVPETLRECWMAGLDPRTWVHEGWVDYLTVAPFNETDPQLKVEEFSSFTRGTKCDLLVSMGDMMGGVWGGPPRITGRGLAQFRECYAGMLLTEEEARAAALNYYTWGAEGISFWNISCNMGAYGKWGGPQQRERIWGWMNAVASPGQARKLPRRYHYLPLYKGMAGRSPPVRNYAWYGEGQSPTGVFKTQVLRFSGESIGIRKAYRFRMADGRRGERLRGLLRFRIFHIDPGEIVTVDINGEVIRRDDLRRTRLNVEEVGLPGESFQVELERCPPFRGDNELGLAFQTGYAATKKAYMEELEVLVVEVMGQSR